MTRTQSSGRLFVTYSSVFSFDGFNHLFAAPRITNLSSILYLLRKSDGVFTNHSVSIPLYIVQIFFPFKKDFCASDAIHFETPTNVRFLIEPTYFLYLQELI